MVTSRRVYTERSECARRIFWIYDIISPMATKRKIISAAVREEKPVTPQPVSELRNTAPVNTRRSETSTDDESSSRTGVRARRECYFCQSKTIPSYTDLVNLRRYLSDRAKIVAKERTGACAKHQRAITRNIKYARHLALLPFVPKI